MAVGSLGLIIIDKVATRYMRGWIKFIVVWKISLFQGFDPWMC
jgi:hypothetical protein